MSRRHAQRFSLEMFPEFTANYSKKVEGKNTRLRETSGRGVSFMPREMCDSPDTIREKARLVKPRKYLNSGWNGNNH